MSKKNLCKNCQKFIPPPRRIFCSRKCMYSWHDNHNFERNRKKREYTIRNKDKIEKRRKKQIEEWKENGRVVTIKPSEIKPLSKETEQILIGSLLGDGCISVTYKRRIVYSEGHCKKQKNYLEWKRRKFKELKPPTRIYKSNTRGTFNLTIHNTDLYPYYKLFYPNGKKELSLEILNKLEPLGLAIWYMDDGSYDRSGECKICCLLKRLNKEFLERFEEKFGIVPRLTSIGIRFRKKDSNKFIEIVKPYIHNDLFYKIDVEGAKKKFKEYLDKYLDKNGDKINKRARESYWRNVEKNRKRMEEYRKNNIEKIRKQARGYYHKNRDKVLKRRKEYNLKNRDKINEYNKGYHFKNKNKINERKSKNYYKKKYGNNWEERWLKNQVFGEDQNIKGLARQAEKELPGVTKEPELYMINLGKK